MKKSRLIQRLRKPIKIEGNSPLDRLAKRNPFAFGGGLKNGGLSNETADKLSKICSFDYMGSAEFEFGALPETLGIMYNLAAIGKLTSHNIALKDGREVYILCNEADLPEVVKRIQSWATKESRETKEAVLLASEHHRDLLGGWIEFNNCFAFFTNKEMANGFRALLEMS